MVPVSTVQLIPWLDRMFSEFLTNEKGIPKFKVHGFGLTSLKLMLRYPWYSVDSTSWVMTGRMGSIYMPRFVNGEWIYDRDSWKITVSNRSPDMKDAGQHFSTMTKTRQGLVMAYLEDKGYTMGKSSFKKVEPDYKPKDGERWAEKKLKDSTAKRMLEIIEEDGISNRYQLRDEMNIIYFLDLEKSMPEWPWPFKGPAVGGFGF
jgi:hypothetical protein